MKGKLGWLVVIAIFVIIGFAVYSFFFGGERVIAFFDREFVIRQNELALVNEEVYVKFLKVEDTRCKGDDCEREGEQVVHLLVINNHHINYIKLGTLAETKMNLDKEYEISLVELKEDNELTLKVIDKNKEE